MSCRRLLRDNSLSPSSSSSGGTTRYLLYVILFLGLSLLLRPTRAAVVSDYDSRFKHSSFVSNLV